MKETEIRAGQPAEIRIDDGLVRVSGHAAVFNERADIGGLFFEQIAPGAFADAVGRDDVVFLVNHAGLPLARTRSGTLTIRENDRGLYMESDLDADDPDVRAITTKMARGDLDKMSFAFIAEVAEWDDSGDIPIRTIKQASLFDVSIVTNPAYSGTDIGLRSLQAYRKSHQPRNQNMRLKRALSASMSRRIV